MKPLLVVLAGPTAVGKTKLAINLANRFQTEIISADSRQIYSELNIGVARPSPEELSSATHHFIATQSIHDSYNVSMYEQDVLAKLEVLFEKYPMVLLTGGSGFYIDTVCRGIDDLPAILPEIRMQVDDDLKSKGLNYLVEKLLEVDPEYYHKADLNNPKRVGKAIEIFMQTGKTYSSFLTSSVRQRNFDILKICLDLPRPLLHERINLRVHEMARNGLLQEVQALLPHRQLNALNTVGYKEVFEYLDGSISFKTAVENIQTNTRQYARRQLTWFRRDKSYHWFEPAQLDEIEALITKYMQHEC